MGRRPKYTFLQRRYADCQQTHEGCSASLIIREMQIKTTMRYHLTPAEWPLSKNLQTISAGEGVEKREPSSGAHAPQLERSPDVATKDPTCRI